MISLLVRGRFVPRRGPVVTTPRQRVALRRLLGVDGRVHPRLMTALVEAVEVGDVVRLLTLQAGGATLAEYTVAGDHPSSVAVSTAAVAGRYGTHRGARWRPIPPSPTSCSRRRLFFMRRLPVVNSRSSRRLARRGP